MDKLNKVVIPKGFKATNIRVENDFLLYDLEPIEKSIKEQVKEWMNNENVKKYWIDYNSNIINRAVGLKIRHGNDNILPTSEHCKQILALEQLMLACWVANGNKIISKEEEFYSLYYGEVAGIKGINRWIVTNMQYKYLVFKDMKTANKFIEEYLELLETAKPFLR